MGRNERCEEVNGAHGPQPHSVLGLKQSARWSRDLWGCFWLRLRQQPVSWHLPVLLTGFHTKKGLWICTSSFMRNITKTLPRKTKQTETPAVMPGSYIVGQHNTFSFTSSAFQWFQDVWPFHVLSMKLDKHLRVSWVYQSPLVFYSKGENTDWALKGALDL